MQARSSRTKIVCLATFVALAFAVPSFGQSKSSTLAKRIQQLRSSQKSQAGGSQSLTDIADNQVYKTMLKSVALVQCVGDDGETSSGTGWVVDVDQRLIITNHHVVEYFVSCSVYFPEYEDGKLVTDPKQSIVDRRANRAQVIDVDPAFDLALLQLDEALPKGIKALEIAEAPGTPGSAVHSVGASTVGAQSLWVYSTGHVRQSVRGLMANDYEATLLESDMATNQGNSGGPVCNDEGKVVAVVEGHRTDARLVSIYVGQQSLVEYLSDALRCVDPKTKEDLVFSANRNLIDGRPNVALRLVDKAIALERESAELMSLRAWCWYDADDAESAKADFSDAIELDRRHADAHAGLGYLAMDADEYTDAVTHFTNAIRNDPQNPDYLVARGRSRRELEDYKTAFRDFNQALHLDTEYEEAIKYRGCTSISMGNLEAGLEDLESVVDSYADDPEIFLSYGEAMLASEEYETAQQFYAKSLELDPDNLVASFGVGASLMEQEQYEESVAYFGKCVDAEPKNPLFLYFFGLSQLANGDAEAFALIERAAKLAPDNEEINNGYKKLLSHREKAQEQNKAKRNAGPIPHQYVGAWGTQFNDDGDYVQLRLRVSTDGSYVRNTVVKSPNGDRNEHTERGRARVGTKSITFYSEDGEEVELLTKWRGRQLMMFFESKNVWVIFHRQNP